MSLVKPSQQAASRNTPAHQELVILGRPPSSVDSVTRHINLPRNPLSP